MVGALLKDFRGLHLATLDTHGVQDRREWLPLKHDVMESALKIMVRCLLP